MLPIREIATKKDLFVAAHRGSSGTAPENTIAAYLEAIKAGADIVEADVQMTQDRKVIAFHDKNISTPVADRIERDSPGMFLFRGLSLQAIHDDKRKYE